MDKTHTDYDRMRGKVVAALKGIEGIDALAKRVISAPTMMRAIEISLQTGYEPTVFMDAYGVQGKIVADAFDSGMKIMGSEHRVFRVYLESGDENSG